MIRLGLTLTICDLIQSYAPTGGGRISSCLRKKGKHAFEISPHRLLSTVPGPKDLIVASGRHFCVEVAAEQVYGHPNYSFILRASAVRDMLERIAPDLIESRCQWLLP